MFFESRKVRRRSFFMHFLYGLLLASFAASNALWADPGAEIARAAASQVGETLFYDPSYQSLAYPLGDVARDKGVCSDVVIRALREIGIDLQKAVHEDMKRHFSSYPQNWGLKRADPNIDHRRVPNLEVYFNRAGYSLPTSQDAPSYQVGDIVSVRLENNLPHIMVVSGQKNPRGIPLAIHNIGQGARLEDCLFRFKINGHYRIKRGTPGV